MNIFKTDGTIDDNAAGEYAFTVRNPEAVACWAQCPEFIKANWRKLGAAIAARVRQELDEISKACQAKAVEDFARTVFADCHPDCKTTFISMNESGADYRRSLIAAVNSMANEIESRNRYIKEQGQRIKDCRADEIETLRETVRSMESQLAACRTALQEQTNKAGKLEKTSALWCERFLEATKANTEIGMMLVEMMMRHGVEPPANEQEAVAASEARAEPVGVAAGYHRIGCKKCNGSGWEGHSVAHDGDKFCQQCCGAGYVLAFIQKSDEVKAK